MRAQEIGLLKEVQRSTERELNALDLLSEKVYDENLALQISRQTLKYSELKNEAARRLLHAKTQGYRMTAIEKLGQNSMLNYQTLINTSTEHVANLMIKNSQDAVLNLETALKHSEEPEGPTTEIVKRLIAIEEKNIMKLKDYL